MPNETSINTIFPPDDQIARFVISTSMARNDLLNCLLDIVRAAETEEMDFFYRIRLTTGHLVEALDALDEYTERSLEVCTFIEGVPDPGPANLEKARGTIDAVGKKALKHLRNSTFHYPNPSTKRTPTTDKLLRNVVEKKGDIPAKVFIDHKYEQSFLTFAADMSIALSYDKHEVADDDALIEQLTELRDGAIAYVNWQQTIVLKYMTDRGFQLEGIDIDASTPTD